VYTKFTKSTKFVTGGGGGLQLGTPHLGVGQVEDKW
jgi:hypothetical protein